MDVIRPRKEGSAVAVAAAAVAASSSSSTSSTSAATSTTGGAVLNGNPMQLLSRALSGSTLNAEAPEFVPKSVIMTSSLSSSVPGPAAQGLGLSPPMLMQSPSSFPPLIVAPFMVQHDVSLPTLGIPAAVATSPVGGDLVSACHSGTIFLGKEQDQAPLHGATGVVAAAAAKQPAVVTEELKAKIVKQVEFYFSDTNLPTDHHLMKYVKKDPQGFVPIPVVASFKKIKNLVKNHGVVAAALRNSLQLVVSEDGKKVRRLHPLPEIDLEEVQARTVVAENLPIDYSVEKLEELFGKVGSVKMVRICHPEAPNGGNQTAVKLPKSDMVISNKLHALVEYETVDLAEKAVAELTDERNWRSGLRVRLLLRRTVYC
jgi:La-related protein 7